MKKAIKLFILFFKINWMQEAEFRVNLLINSLMSVGWAFLMLLFTQIIYGHVSTIGGWTKQEVILLVITQAISWGLLTIALLPGIDSLSNKIKQGNLDQLLVKPVSSRLLLAISDQNMDGLLRIPVLVVILIIISRNLLIIPTMVTFMFYFTILILGVFIIYNIFFMIYTSVFWLVDLSNMGSLNSKIAETAQFPPEAFSLKIRIFMCYLIPTIFMAAVPTKILLGGHIWPSLILTIIVAIVTFVISQIFWNFALRHYSSASS